MAKQQYAVPPRRWPWILAIVVVIAAAVLAWSVTRGGDGGDDEPGKKADPDAAVQPADGCLGGSDPIKAILPAQEQAPLTGDGAAAFLATYLRWLFVTPRPVDDLDEVGPQVWVPGIDEKWTETPKEEDGPIEVTLDGAHYRVEEIDETTATVALTYEFTNGETVTAGGGGIHVLEVVDGLWRYRGLDEAATNEAAGTDEGVSFRKQLNEAGIPFQRSC